MQDQPRQHHFIPQFYLAGFTVSGKKDGHLYVFDQVRREQWKSTPAKAARRHDFHAIDVQPGHDPMVIEKQLAEIEGKCSRVVRNVLERQELPSGEDLEILVNFVALMAVRVPAIRDTISEFANQYTVEFDRSWHVGMMLELGSKLVPVLAQRHWSIWIVEDDAPDLICSDRPVCLTWYSSNPPPFPPGFAFPDTSVIMPLGRRVAISGTFEDRPTKSTLDRHGVGTVNRSTREYAGQLYSPEHDFVWAMTDERLGDAAELLEALKCSG